MKDLIARASTMTWPRITEPGGKVFGCMAEKRNGGLTHASMLWRRVDQPGHESARLVHEDPYWHLSGAAVFVYDGEPCRLDYLITCNSRWETRLGRVSGWVGDQAVEIEISVDSGSRWFVNGNECDEAQGCIDLDLNFSPSTNLLPIRRLNLAVGEQAQVRAAWLRFPGFALEPLDQIYRRTGATTYVYESAGGRFTAELRINEAGFVTDYASLWVHEAST